MAFVQQTRHALGSEATLTLVGNMQAQLETLISQLWQDVRLFEQTFSRFIADSELSRVNGRAGLPVPVSPEFVALTRRAQSMSADTSGLYNPLILPNLQRAGYKGSWPNPTDLGDVEDYSDREMADARSIQITTYSVALPANTALDFGGIGKGYLLDQLAETLEEAGCQDFWLSLGGDILAAGRDGDGVAWQIGVASAATGLGAVTVETAAQQRLAVATSGTIKRRGPGWHHIIDPETGKPAETDILSATVCSESATKADVYAKCLVLAGTAGSDSFAQEHGITKFVLQYRGKDDKLVVDKKGL